MSVNSNGTAKALLVVVAGFAGFTAGGSNVGAQNLVLNGEFDVDTSGWLQTGGDPTPDWLVIDHDECGVDSGAARAENDVAGSGGVQYSYSSCILELSGSAPYTLDGFLRIPSGQARTGGVWISISWFDSALDCQGNYLGGELTSQLLSTNPDVWVHRALRNIISQPGTLSAEVRVSLYKEEAAGTLLANFDGIHLVAGNGYLFGEGFEGETSCRWSEVVP